MNTKRTLARLLTALGLAAGVLGTAGAARAQTVNCLVALVGGRPVTLMDLEVARAFGLFDPAILGTDGDPRRAVLEALIGQKVVLEMTREPMSFSREELDLALGAVRDKAGPAAFSAGLRRFGLREADLRPYLEERLRYDRIVAARFPAAVLVSRADVEKHYRDVYAPGQKAKGLEPEPLEAVLPALEAAVRDTVRDRKVAEWVRMIRAQAEVRINADCLK